MPSGPTLLRASTAAFLGTGALLGAQVAYAVRRDLPSFEGFDVSIEIGSEDLPLLRISAFGDSTLTGPGLTGPEDAWIRLAIGHLEDRHRIVLDSRAAGGSRAADVARAVGGLDGADIAVIAVGSNDALHGTPLTLVEHHLRRAVAELLGRCRLVILTGVGDLGAIPRFVAPLSWLARRRADAVDAVHEGVARDHPRVLKVPVGELTNRRFRAEPDLFAGDLFHASALGHELWAAAFLPTLERALGMLAADPAGG